MGKKKFKDGLESLFLEAREENLSQKSPLLLETEQQAAPKKTGRASSGKHFSDDLELFFQESLRESIEEELSSSHSGQSMKAARGSRSSRPKDGLDALIRRTIESSEIDLRYDGAKKRIAFSFEQEKLAKLKQIAKLEKTFLKDMIARIVADYIREYEQQKGGV